MKYKLVDIKTQEQHLCDKVTIDGFEYYVGDTDIRINDYYLTFDNGVVIGNVRKCEDSSYNFIYCKKVIACNNPNIDIPNVGDEVELLAKEYVKGEEVVSFHTRKGYKTGYNKSQETHPNSDEDMIEFTEWCIKEAEWYTEHNKWMYGYSFLTTKELLQLWKEQRPKIIYHE